MRYLIVSYLKKPNGKMDEVIAVSKRVRLKDLQSASVILDFQEGKVLISTLDGVTVPKDFLKIRDFYHQHYRKLIDDLEAVYGRFEIADDSASISSDTDPVSQK